MRHFIRKASAGKTFFRAARRSPTIPRGLARGTAGRVAVKVQSADGPAVEIRIRRIPG
jgi:hypothetical protein